MSRGCQVPSLVPQPAPPPPQRTARLIQEGKVVITTCSVSLPSPNSRASFAAQSRRTSTPPTRANMTAVVSLTRSPAISASCAASRSASLWAWPWTVRGWVGEAGQAAVRGGGAFRHGSSLPGTHRAERQSGSGWWQNECSESWSLLPSSLKKRK